MQCCSTELIESRFDRAYVKKKLDRYHRKGPKKTTVMLVDAIVEHMQDGMTLLDIGGGIGDIQHMLIPQGVASTINCEAAGAFLEACEAEAARRGYADRIRHVQGDFVEIAGEVPGADIVTLDRVICCYPDMPELVQASLAKAAKLYGIVIPSNNWLIKFFTSVYYNVRFLLQRNPFRVFNHPLEAIEEIIRSNGFKQIYNQKSSGWVIQLYTS